MNIKIRGWHTTQKKMFSAEEMAEDQLTLLPTGSFINVSSTSVKLSIIYPKDKFIPLLYTGRNDINGMEIYDGHLLRDTFTGSIKEVYWDDRCCQFRLCSLGDKQFDKTDSLIHVHKMGIVGTRFENPELLGYKEDKK